MIKTFCDRCGTEVEELGNRDNCMWFGHINGREMLYKKSLDLCNDCVTSLRNWIKYLDNDDSMEVNDGS